MIILCSTVFYIVSTCLIRIFKFPSHISKVYISFDSAPGCILTDHATNLGIFCCQITFYNPSSGSTFRYTTGIHIISDNTTDVPLFVIHTKNTCICLIDIILTVFVFFFCICIFSCWLFSIRYRKCTDTFCNRFHVRINSCCIITHSHSVRFLFGIWNRIKIWSHGSSGINRCWGIG